MNISKVIIVIAGTIGTAAAADQHKSSPKQADAVLAAPVDAVSGDEADRTVVVTGRRLSETEAGLKSCLARKCPPREDVAATLAHAENLFVAGDYADARIALGKSLDRNRRHAHDLPIEVAGLSRAYARVSAHMGYADTERLATFATVDALKKGLAGNDARVLAQRLETGDMFARSGKVDMAVSLYRQVARQGSDNALPMIEGHALLRLCTLYGALATIDRGTWAQRARSSLRTLQATTAPELAPFREAARLVEAQVAEYGGDKNALDRLIASYRSERTEQPKLIYAPPIETGPNSVAAQLPTSVTARMPLDYADDQWIDVGFWIEEDGSVSEPGVVRQSAKLRDFWVSPVLRNIAVRRYAPLRQRSLRVERYSRTARLLDITESRIRQRAPAATIEMIDLTAGPTGS